MCLATREGAGMKVKKPTTTIEFLESNHYGSFIMGGASFTSHAQFDFWMTVPYAREGAA
jgi:hypothetical protein